MDEKTSRKEMPGAWAEVIEVMESSASEPG